MTAWLEATALATWVRTSPSIWAYPTILTIHTLGLGIVVGASAIIDLRFLGFAPGIDLPSLLPLFSFIWWSFLVNAATGTLLFIAEATTKSVQLVFYIKLSLIGLALWNTVIARRAVRQNREAPALAITSLLLWSAAITAGRLMAYL